MDRRDFLKHLSLAMAVGPAIMAAGCVPMPAERFPRTFPVKKAVMEDVFGNRTTIYQSTIVFEPPVDCGTYYVTLRDLKRLEVEPC